MTYTIAKAYRFDFYGSSFRSFMTEDKQIFVPLGELCKTLGINLGAQVRRIHGNSALADKLADIEVGMISEEKPYRGVIRCLNLEALPQWLAYVNAKKVKPELHDRLVRYQREFVHTMWAAYRADILPKELRQLIDNVPTLESR